MEDIKEDYKKAIEEIGRLQNKISQYEWTNSDGSPSTKLGAAIKILSEALKEDTSEGSYYYGWQANMAMSFQDEFWRNIKSHMDLDLLDESVTIDIFNKAAKRFLNQLIGSYE